MPQRVIIRVIIDELTNEEVLAAIEKIKEALADKPRVTVELLTIR
jgi:hypothetical protein